MARNRYDIDETLEEQFDFRKLGRALVYVKPYTKKMLLALVLDWLLPAMVLDWLPLALAPVGLSLAAGLTLTLVAPNSLNVNLGAPLAITPAPPVEPLRPNAPLPPPREPASRPESLKFCLYFSLASMASLISASTVARGREY